MHTPKTLKRTLLIGGLLLGLPTLSSAYTGSTIIYPTTYNSGFVYTADLDFISTTPFHLTSVDGDGNSLELRNRGYNTCLSSNSALLDMSSWGQLLDTSGDLLLSDLSFGSNVANYYDPNRSSNANSVLASTISGCLTSDGSNYHYTFLAPSLTASETAMLPALVPDSIIEVSCLATETYASCYEKGRLAYNSASCNGGGAGSCGTSSMTAAESLQTTTEPGKGFNLSDSSDEDANLTAASNVIEPVQLLSTATSSGEAMDVFDFTLSDGAGGDQLSTDISELVIHTSGTGDFESVIWQLNGTGMTNITGSYDSVQQTLTFSNLQVSIADGNSQDFILSAYIDTSAVSTPNNGDIFLLSIDGDTDVVLDADKTQMGDTTAVTASISYSSNQAPTIDGVVINGKNRVGNELTAVLQNYVDPEGDAEGVHQFIWSRSSSSDCSDSEVITSATSESYTLSADDKRSFVCVTVIPADDQGSISEISATAVTTKKVKQGRKHPHQWKRGKHRGKHHKHSHKHGNH